MQARKKPPLTVIAALAALAACAARADEPSPWYVGASQALTHDSNVYRLADGAVDPNGRARSDNYWSTGLLGGFDQPIGRQRLHGTANVAYNKYQNHDNLNNTSYGLNAGWDWSTAWNLSGGVNVGANQSLAQLNGNAAAPSTTRNVVKTDQIGANVRWGGTGLLSVQGDYTHSRVRYSNQGSGSANSSADSGSLGTYYNVGPDITAGLALRLTRTDAPFGYSSSSRGRNIDLSLNWRTTAQTGVNSRLSWTRQSNSGGGADFSGLTGSLSANYAPTAKLAFNANYSRDAGSYGSFFNAPATTGTNTTAPILLQNSQVADSVSLGANYAATAKINVNAGYQYRKARISNTAAAGAGSTTDDTLQTASLGASWAIARAWQLGCSLSREKREVATTPVYAYSANIAACTAQLTLR